MKYWKLTIVLYLFSVVGYILIPLGSLMFYPSFFPLFKKFLFTNSGLTFSILCELSIFIVIVKTIIFWSKNDKKAVNLIFILFFNFIFIPVYFYYKIVPHIKNEKKIKQ